MSEIKIERLHALGGDDNDLGWYAKGHHNEQAFRAALEAHFWIDTPRGRERFKHSCEADETECRFVQTWWRTVPCGGGEVRFQTASPNSRGAFPVTAMLTPEAEF